MKAIICALSLLASVAFANDPHAAAPAATATKDTKAAAATDMCKGKTGAELTKCQKEHATKTH